MNQLFAASSILLMLLAIALPAATQVKAPTLRDEVRKKGYVWYTVYPDDRTLATFLDLINRSELIVRGRVVDEKTRLSPDERSVLTDYTIEVLEALKDVKQLTKVGDHVVVTKTGGNLVIDGKPVRIDTPLFPPVPWVAPHVFFIARWKGPSPPAEYHFVGVGIGVLEIYKGKLTCGGPPKRNHPAVKEYCDMNEEDFIRLLKKTIAEPARIAPQP